MWQSLKNVYHLAVAFLFQALYGFPSRKLTIIGVTGTSGKTTTAHMIHEMLVANGHKTALLSTIKAIIGGKSYDTGFHVTTPDPHKLPKYLSDAVKAGDTHLVLEVSSHALDQNRAACVGFRIGVLTTLAHEHLDYHKTFANYARAKFKLLQAAITGVAPENLSEEIKKVVSYDKLINKIVTFGIDAGDVSQKSLRLALKAPGAFNVRNALAAAAVGKILGIPETVVKKSLQAFVLPAGRFEEIPTNNNFRVIIDFAHKPDALEEVLLAARGMVKKPGRIIAVFGCASQRDLLKRPLMGEISGKLADITVLTDEDPRFESPEKIIEEIAAGARKAGAVEISDINPDSIGVKNQISNRKGHMYFKIPNRKEAIEFTITQLAKPGDILLFCGKGHEQSMNYNGKELPWSEHTAIANALKLKIKVKNEKYNAKFKILSFTL